MQESKKGIAQWIPARYILAILGFTGISLQYILKVNLSVAIVAMVRTNSKNNENSYEESCPRNTTDSLLDMEEGEFDWNISQEGLLLSSYYYGYVATQLLGGYLSQMFGGRLVMGPGVALTGVLTLLTVFVARTSYEALIVLRVLEGVASGVVIPSMQAIFSGWYPPQERQRFSGFIFSSVNFGSLAGMGLSGLLADWGGWPYIFYVTGGMAVVWFIPWIFLVYDSPKTHPRISTAEKNYILNGLGQDPSVNRKTPKRVPWIQIILCPAVWAGILTQTGSAWILFTLLNELPTFLSNVLHFNVKNSGVISSLPYLFAWISSVGSGALSQWLRSRGYMSHITAYKFFNGIMCVGVTVCFLVITLVGCDSTTIVAMFVVAMFCNGCIYGGSYLNHVDLSPNHAGAISGILHTILNSPGFITPIVTSALLDGQHTIERWQKVFYVSMGIICGVYLFYLIFGSVTEQSWNSWGMEDDEESPEKPKESNKEQLSILSNLKNDHSLPNYGS